ncbi:MAG TPA: hypothetical protein VI603_13875 [Saprospiraceae bacterium]|nr:hypothetical protein [Saprospiraceae bacterium]
MKHLLFILILCPLSLWAQETEYLIFENNMITPVPGRVLQFEAVVGAHNKKYHGPGAYGVRVYSIVSGRNSGKYIWAMGPTHWSALDMRPDDPTHNFDWTGNVVPNLLSESNTTYWRFHADKSQFPQDFDVKRLMIWQVNISEDGYDKTMAIMDKVHKVYVDKFPMDSYGVYTNELASTSEGNDLAIVWFFDKWSWMSEDNEFNKKYDEVHGAGSFEKMLVEWTAATEGVDREIWEYREDLSGLGPRVIVAERQ